jgi:serine/threonine protein kinase
MPTPAPRASIGPWYLEEVLGRGGNAQVWQATRAGLPTPVALKVINTTKVEKEPYQRFVREITFLREHQDTAGVLPLLDAHLPEHPSSADQPWLAMPIAVPIKQALEGRPLSDVVTAIAQIAETLARLQQEHGIAHRDIKPGNLYERNGTWLIGDFGLVSIPGADALTAEGRQVGPAHYTAYEMILDASTADPHPADVYSLGKTFWVLATGQTWPPEGHQPAGSRGFGIGDFFPHPRASALDQEVDLMSRLRPEERPSKGQVARDLAQWNELATAPVVLDVSEARARLNAKLQAKIAEQDIHEQQKELAYAAIRRLQELTAPLNDALRELYPRATIDSQSDEMTRKTVKTHEHRHRGMALLLRWQRCTLLAPFERPMSCVLRMSRCVELFGNGTLRLILMANVRPEGVMGTYYSSEIEIRDAPVGSIEAERMLEDGIRDLAEALKLAIEMFIQHQPEAT